MNRHHVCPSMPGVQVLGQSDSVKYLGIPFSQSPVDDRILESLDQRFYDGFKSRKHDRDATHIQLIPSEFLYQRRSDGGLGIPNLDAQLKRQRLQLMLQFYEQRARSGAVTAHRWCLGMVPEPQRSFRLHVSRVFGLRSLANFAQEGSAWPAQREFAERHVDFTLTTRRREADQGAREADEVTAADPAADLRGPSVATRVPTSAGPIALLVLGDDEPEHPQVQWTDRKDVVADVWHVLRAVTLHFVWSGRNRCLFDGRQPTPVLPALHMIFTTFAAHLRYFQRRLYTVVEKTALHAVSVAMAKGSALAIFATAHPGLLLVRGQLRCCARYRGDRGVRSRTPLAHFCTAKIRQRRHEDHHSLRETFLSTPRLLEDRN
ncbi:hypothetical protein PybrP1_012564, partial [[Pythium] brassicae (nom. inval.)]